MIVILGIVAISVGYPIIGVPLIIIGLLEFL